MAILGAAVRTLSNLWDGLDSGQRADIDRTLDGAGDAVARSLGVAFAPPLGAESAAQLLAALKLDIVGGGVASAGAVAGAPKRIRTAAEMDVYIEKLDQRLSSAGDDAQLANVDLQNALNQQQQTLQQMTNIAKVLHETAMAIIRKQGT
jgi:hypothetical protein